MFASEYNGSGIAVTRSRIDQHGRLARIRKWRLGIGAICAAFAWSVAASSAAGSSNSDTTPPTLTSAELAPIDSFIRLAFPNVRALVVSHRGHVVHETYFDPEHRDRPQRVHSITKSVVGVLAGIAQRQGKLPALDTPLGEIYPHLDVSFADGAKAISLRHLLTMSTGQQWYERGATLWRWAFSKDRRRAVLALPVVRAPGSQFLYSSAASDLLGAVVADSVDEPLLDFAQRTLFDPLGITDVAWLKRASPYYNGGAGLVMRPRDLARIGQLMLDKGRADERQIVPEAWVQASTQAQISAGPGQAYGYQWWVQPTAGCRSFRAIGRGGQFVVVVPELALTMVLTSTPALGTTTAARLSQIFDRIARVIPAKCAPLPVGPTRVGGGPDYAAELRKLPPAIRALFAGCTKAGRRGDLDATMGFYHDHFWLDGATKASRRQLWQSLGAVGPNFGYSVDSLVLLDPSRALFNGHVHGAFGRLGTSVHIVRTADGWRFQGDRFAGNPIPDVPARLDDFLRAFMRAANAGDEALIARFFAPDYLANGYLREDMPELLTELGAQRPSLLAHRIMHLQTERSESASNETRFDLHGYWRFEGLGFVPMAPLYGAIVERAGRLYWHGNQLEYAARGAARAH